MSNETCPNCGAEKDNPVGAIQLYKCGTLETSYVPASECYHRQLAQKDAEIERLRTANETMAGMVLTAIADEREACAKICDDEAFYIAKMEATGRAVALMKWLEKTIRARGEVK